MKQLPAEYSVSLTELKKNPGAFLAEAKGAPIAIFNDNIPTAYLIPAETYEWIMEALDDHVLAKLVEERMSEKSDAVAVSLNDL